MKKSLFLSLLIAIVALISCDKKPEYQSIIPTNPVAVVKSNLGQILKKSELLQDNQIGGFAKMAINNLPEECRTIYRDILNDPNTSGLNLDQPAFIVFENIEQFRGFALLAINNDVQLKNVIEVTLQQMGAYDEIALETTAAYNVIKDKKGNSIAAFDNNKLVIAFAKETADATEYMKPAQNNGESNSTLDAFIKKQDDLGIYIDYNDFIRLSAMLSKEMQGFNLDDLKNVKLVSELNFENGKIVLNSKLSGYDKAKEAFNSIYGTPDSKLFQYIPANSWGVMLTNTKDANKLKEAMPQASITQIEELLNKINEELADDNCDAKITFSLLSSLKGDIIAALLPPVEEMQQEVPQGIFISECADDKLFNTIKNILSTEMDEKFQEIQPNVIALNINSKIDWENSKHNESTGKFEWKYNKVGYDYYFGYIDNKMFVMPENIFNQCCANGKFNKLDANAKNENLCDIIKNRHAIAIDFEKIAKYFETSNHESLKPVGNILRKFTDATLTWENGTESNMQINFRNKEINALKMLKNMIFEISMLSMSL